jgi:hypothetical protein
LGSKAAVHGGFGDQSALRTEDAQTVAGWAHARN